MKNDMFLVAVLHLTLFAHPATCAARQSAVEVKNSLIFQKRLKTPVFCGTEFSGWLEMPQIRNESEIRQT